MNKALYSRDNVDKLYVTRKEGGLELDSNEDSVGASMQRLEDYIKKCVVSGGWLQPPETNRQRKHQMNFYISIRGEFEITTFD